MLTFQQITILYDLNFIGIELTNEENCLVLTVPLEHAFIELKVLTEVLESLCYKILKIDDIESETRGEERKIYTGLRVYTNLPFSYYESVRASIIDIINDTL
jgi:hypothetical protein